MIVGGERKVCDMLMDSDEDQMMLHILECVAALVEKQRVRVASKKQLILSTHGVAVEVTAVQQAARNKVFQAALALMAGGMTHDGADAIGQSQAVRQLSDAFPGVCKMYDGRGWLPLHWAVVAAGEPCGVTTADVKAVYSMIQHLLHPLHIPTQLDLILLRKPTSRVRF